MNTDAELVQLTLSGEVSAFDTLVRRWSARVCAYTASKVHLRHVSEELAQETFFRAFRSLSALQSHEKFGSWLLSIAHRLAIDWLKAKARSEMGIADLTQMGQEMTSPTKHNSSTPNHEGGRHEALVTEIEKLPEKLKEVLMIYYYDDVTYQELAKMLDVSVATINARLTQARSLLRERLMNMENQA